MKQMIQLDKYERLYDAVGESCSVTCLSVSVPASSVIINTSVETEFCPEFLIHA